MHKFLQRKKISQIPLVLFKYRAILVSLCGEDLTEEFITFGVFDNLLFTFEHYLEQEEDCISLDVSFRVKSIKSDEILCASLEIDEPDLDFKILNEYGVRSFP